MVSARNKDDTDDESSSSSKKYSSIIRFLVSLQANAPGAVVQIFLTKTDLVNDPKAKADWQRLEW